jgi:hypothetical protein
MERAGISGVERGADRPTAQFPRVQSRADVGRPVRIFDHEEADPTSETEMAESE